MGLVELQYIWFTVFVLLIVGYAILDGFDLGVGMLHLFARSDTERRLMLNSIGPVWDGNEVWLVTAGGALFAGFPPIYATLCSSFYMPVMMLLSGLIFRAVAIEFRSKQPMTWYRWMWDILFFLSSLLIAFMLGLILGNLIRGIPLDAQGEYLGSSSDLFNPYAILVGALTAALFAMHGAIYILMKSEGVFHDHMRVFVNPTIIVFVMLYAIATAATLIYMPHMKDILTERPLYFGIVIVNMLAIANIPREINLGRDPFAFASSCLNMVCLLALFALGTYPNVVRASNGPDALSLTIFNSSSTEMTLQILLIMAVIGLPLVMAYTVTVYVIFRGKVKLDANSY